MTNVSEPVRVFGTMLGLCLLLAGGASSAQKLSAQVEVSLLTYDPGDELYAAFGHSALRVRDSVRKYDKIFNYGMFS